jgi:pimeloyl-ACP methyl ester carboxylesterase
MVEDRQLSGPTIPNPPLVRQARNIMRLPSGGALHVWGPAGALPLLFYHGVSGGAWSWEPQLAALSGDIRCYAWEARGHGLARAVTDAGLGDYYVDAHEALDAVTAADGPPFVAGHSMGGLLALALSAERPADVRGTALVDPVYAPDGGAHAGPLFAAFARRAVRPLVGSLQRNGPLAQRVGRAIFKESFVERACMERAWRRQRTQVPLEYPKMMYEAFDGPTRFPNRAFARELAGPVLLLEPEANARPRFPQLVAELERLGDRFTYLALDGGHYLQLDRSAAHVTRALREFVTRWSR